MYSKVVYDYFNSNPKKFIYKPNKLVRRNAFKKKASKKTVLMPQKNSSLIEDASQTIKQSAENRSAVNFVYDTVLCIWKYAKSFISNQNNDSSRYQEHTRKKINYRISSRINNLKSLRNILDDQVEKSCEPIKDTNEDDIIVHGENVDEDLSSKTSTNLQALKPQSTEVLNLKEQLVCQDFGLSLFEANNEKLISPKCDNITSKEMLNTKLDDEVTPCKISIKRKPKNKTSSKHDLHINQAEPESLNVVEVQILKSSMKTYGRGKRKTKKLHVHFKEEYDTKKGKYASNTSKNLRVSDCCHPNAFRKKITKKHTVDKKNSTNIRGKKRRLALCTKSSRSSLKKKRTKHNSSSNISIQSKTSDCYDNKACKYTRKTPKKYSVCAATKIYKKKLGSNCKRGATNKKTMKTLQDIIKTISDTKINHNDTKEVMMAALNVH